MKLLALESSGLVASVAVWCDGSIVGEFTTNFKKTHSQTLMPMLDALMSTLGIEVDEMDAIAVSGGPGSFTGLRIGSATAKGLGLALNIPLISVPTVDSIAYNLYGNECLICPLMDARRQQVYTGLYTFSQGDFVVLQAQQAVSILEIIQKINLMNKPVIFLGDGVPVFEQIIESNCHTEYQFAPAHLSRQRAGALASLAALYYAQGKTQPADDYSPDYLRLSQAERELAQKQAKVNQNDHT